MPATLLIFLLLAPPSRAASARAEEAAPAEIPRFSPSAPTLFASAPALTAMPSLMAAPAPSPVPVPPAAAPPDASASPPVENDSNEARPTPASEPDVRIHAVLYDPFETKTADEPPAVEDAARLDREFARRDFWPQIAPAAKTEIEGLRAKKLSKAAVKEYVRREVNAAFDRIKAARGTENIGLHFNLHGGARASYVGAGIRAARGDIALRRSTNGDANDKVYFFQTGAHEAYSALDASNGELLFIPSRMGHALSAFALDAPELKAALADGRIANPTAISMDFHKGMRGVPYSAFLAPPLEVFVDTARKIGLRKLTRDEETLATARYLEAALIHGGAYIPGGAPAAAAPKIEIDPRVEAIRADPEMRKALDEWRERNPLFKAKTDYRLRQAAFAARDLLFGRKKGPALSGPELELIQFYCGFLYSPLNKYLRGRTKPASPSYASAMNAVASLIVSGLDKLPDYRGAVTRYIFTDGPELPARFVVGGITSDPGFSSATRNRTRFLPYGGGTIGIKLVIDSLTGKSVERISFGPAEKEVIFKPGTRFLVAGKKETTVSIAGRPHKEYVVRLRELPAE